MTQQSSFWQFLAKEWLEGVKLFFTQKIGVFLWLTWNAFTKAFFDFFPLAVGLLLSKALVSYIFLIYDGFAHYAFWIKTFLNICFVYGAILAIRPSVANKDCAYYTKYFFKYGYLFLLGAGLSVIIYYSLADFIPTLFSLRLFQDSGMILFYGLFSGDAIVVPSVFLVYYGFFLLDSEKKLLDAPRSIFRVLKLLLTSITFLLITTVILLLIAAVLLSMWIAFYFLVTEQLYMSVRVYIPYLYDPLAILSCLWCVSWLNTYYLMQVFDDYSYYFE